ncbi:MAG TPA: prepilin-type N-terminal cleavage/methylation domain-containing protein [Persephonella sp.]|uniref:Prepilin-type N-cleavage/methylation domain protein n=1 Tax=Persephonella marina (strain DSM 14350 / EX-H1) TaxID=123214 RepID=C0QPK7_PERMH|nr:MULTISPECIES: prepilin-type N-terminal cleavage/methylation domain-containing protein [Persephonella]ACO03232.1 prepilin-type N- cleavage/methylation domain protein [Persephonella marina EX-H1]HCB69782.1 prepilin-type N-terminal cleavage/methylation domain-containing protein [Persephonella sp.]
MRDKRGFTLLEVLLVLTLILLVFGVVGFSYISNVRDSMDLTSRISKYTQYLSVTNQLSKQIFARFEKKEQNFLLDRDRISFYTLYPLFYSGAVRAEYRIKKTEEGRYILVYEEFPYIDGKLGWDGIKKITIGNFKKISFFAVDKGKIYENFRGKSFPDIIKIIIDDQTFYITAGR